MDHGTGSKEHGKWILFSVVRIPCSVIERAKVC